MNRHFVQLSPAGLLAAIYLGAMIAVTVDMVLFGYAQAALLSFTIIVLLVGIVWSDAVTARTGTIRHRPGSIFHRIEAD
jgi:hypothetical protein